MIELFDNEAERFEVGVEFPVPNFMFILASLWENSSEYPSPVKRPAYSVLDKRTFKETFSIKVPYWVDSLEKCIKNLSKQ